MKTILLILAVLIVACGGGEAGRTDKNRPCYDECDENADCADGMACSRTAGNLCVPRECIKCFMSGKWCDLLEVYEPKSDFPICQFDRCDDE